MNTPPFALLRVPLCPVSTVQEVEQSQQLNEQMLAAIHLSTSGLACSAIAQDPIKRLRLAARMSLRATPFGAYAGTGVVPVGEALSLSVGAALLRTRISTDQLKMLATEMSDEIDVFLRPVRLNPLAYSNGEYWFGPKDATATASTFRIRTSATVELVAGTLGSEWTTVRQLASLIAPSASLEALTKVETFLLNLVEIGLLTCAPVIVGAGVDPTSRVRQLAERAASVAASDRSRLHDLSPIVGRVNTDMVERQEKLWTTYREQSGRAPLCLDEHRFYSDLTFDVGGSLSSLVVSEIQNAAARLRELVGSTDQLAIMRDRFLDRFGDDEVPLLSAFNVELGIDAPASRREAPIANRCAVSVRSLGIGEDATVPRHLHDLLPAVASGVDSIELGQCVSQEETFDALCHAHLLHPGGEDDLVAQLISYVGRSPLSLLGRFTFDREDLAATFADYMDEWEQAACRDGQSLADVFVDVEGRSSNVVQRGRLSRSVIDVWSTSVGGIELRDLWVSVVDGRFVVRRGSDGCHVVPILNTAHNFALSEMSPVYRFLGYLADRGSGSWSWGALSGIARLPRVVAGRVIVAPRSWRVSAELVKEIQASNDPRSLLLSRYPEIEDLDWLSVELGDEDIAFAIGSNAQVSSAFRSISGDLRIAEAVFAERPPITGESGARHAAEVLIPGGLPADPVEPHGLPFSTDDSEVLPSGVWRYWKLYCSRSAMDRVVIAIASALGPAAFEDLPEVRWFFVRYGDPDDHLRVRVLDPPAQVVASIERALDDLSSQGLVWKVLEDRYLPEHRRYGGRSSLAAAERTFWWSTIRATNVLSAGLSSEDRLVEGVRDAVSIAGWIAPPQVGALGMLTGHLAGLPFELDTRKPGFQKMYRALRKERDALARAQPERVPESFVELATSVSSNLSEGDQLGVASSILHMHLNRLLDVEPWRLEPIVVELARRVLISRMHLTPAAIEETDSHA